MGRRTAPSRSRDGRHRITIRVEHRLSREELISAVMLAAEMSSDPEAYAERPVAQVRADVADLLRTDGSLLGSRDGMGVGDLPAAYARAEAIVTKAWPPFPLDPPRPPEPGRRLEVRPRGRGGIDLVPVDDGPPPTFEWPPPDRPTLDELPSESDDERAALGATFTLPDSTTDETPTTL